MGRDCLAGGNSWLLYCSSKRVRRRDAENDTPFPLTVTAAGGGIAASATASGTAATTSGTLGVAVVPAAFASGDGAVLYSALESALSLQEAIAVATKPIMAVNTGTPSANNINTNAPAILSFRFVGLDGSIGNGGLIFEIGGSSTGGAVYFTSSGDLVARAGSGAADIGASSAISYITIPAANAPSGNGVLLVEFTTGTSAVRMWWNDTLIGSTVARSGTGAWADTGGGVYLNTPQGTAPTGAPATAFTGYAKAFPMNYYYNQTIGAEGSPTITSPGTISGSQVPGAVLTVSGEDYTAGATPTYQWTRDAVDIVGATQASYVPAVADIGTTIARKMTVTNGSGSDEDTATGVAISPFEYQVKWDSYYKHASVTLSASNSRAITATSGLFQARTDTWWGTNAPKFYAEFLFPGGNLVNAFATIGITQFFTAFTAGVGTTAANAEMTFVKLNGGAASDARFGDTTLTAWDRSAGSTVRVAVDPANRKCWFGNPSGWDGDPEAGTGGFNLPDYERLCFHCTPRSQGSGTGYFEILSMDADFGFAVPTGFVSYGKIVSTQEKITPKASDDMVEMIGINTHLNRRWIDPPTNSIPNDWATDAWHQDFYDLGIRYMRTALATQAATFSDLATLFAAPASPLRGVLVHLATNSGGDGVYSTTNITNYFNAVVANMDPSQVIGFYGPNEPNITGTDPAWAANSVTAQKHVFDTVNANGTYASKPVLSIAFWNRSSDAQDDFETAAAAASTSMAAISDVTDGHYYTDGSRPSQGNTLEHDYYHMNRVLAQWRDITDDDELWVSEYGHHTYDIGTDSVAAFTPTPSVAANYFLRGLVEWHNRGAYKVFLYTLFDDYDTTTDEYGLIRRDAAWPAYTGQKRPAYGAVQRFIDLFEDATPVSSPTDLRVTITGHLSNIKSAWHQKSNGTYLLTLFNDEQTWDRTAMAEVAFPDRLVNIGFGQQIGEIAFYDPTTSATRSVLGTSVYRISVPVPDEVRVFEITPNAVAGVAPVITNAGTITGTPNIGQTLTHSGLSYTGTEPVTIARQWRADGVNIPGATGSTYTLTSAEDADTITVNISASSAHGSDNATTAGVDATYAAPVKSGNIPASTLTVGVAMAEVDFADYLSSGSGGTWSVTTGALPAGLSRTLGAITGTPTTAAAQATLGLSYTNSGGAVEITWPVTVAGETAAEDPADVSWIREPFSSQARFEDAQLSGIVAFPKQFWHGGDRSHINPDKVMFGMDVNQPARLELRFTHSSGNEYLYWSPVKGIGLDSRLTATVRASGTSEDTWIVLMANGNAGASGAGLYRTTDYGDTWTRVQAITDVRGGVGGWGGNYRQNRRMVTWWPSNPSKWICVNSHYNSYVSTNDGVGWANQGTLPAAMGNVFWVACHPTNTNTAYAATSTGLFRTQNSGQTWGEFATGLPSGNKFICGLDINPNNANEITVAVLDQGLYRSTNGTAFSSLYSHQCTAGFAISPANRNNCWLFGTRDDRNGSTKSGNCFMRYSTNLNSGSPTFTEIVPHLSGNGVSESSADIKGEWMGWAMDDYQLRMRDDGGSQNKMRTIVLPHPTIAGDAIAHGSTVFWWTKNVQTWYNQSFGMDSLGWGDASEGNLEWSGSGGDNVKAGIFDDGMYRSSTHGDWWVLDNSGQVGGMQGGLTQYANYCCSTNPGNANEWVATVGYYGNSTVAKKTGGNWSWATTGDTMNKNTWCKWATASVVYTSKFRSTNGASSFSEYPATGRPFSTNTGTGGVIGCSPANTSVIFAAADGLKNIYRSTNQGNAGTWEGPIILPAHIQDDRAHMTKCFTPHESDARRFYVYSTSLGLRSYGFQGLTTIEYGGAGLLTQPQVVRVDPNDPNVKYVFGRDNGAQTNVIRTINNGVTWEDISRNLPRTGSLRGMEIDPTNGDVRVGGTCGTYLLPAPYGDADSRYWDVRDRSVPTYTGGETEPPASGLESGLVLHATFTAGQTQIFNKTGTPPAQQVGRDAPAVFACDFTGLDGSSGGIIFEFGGSTIGAYCGFAANGDLHVRCGGPGPLPTSDCAYLIVDSGSAPSGNGTLVVEFTPGVNTVRVWWNGSEIGTPVARASGSSDWTGTAAGGYLAVDGVVPGGEFIANAPTYATASNLRYYWNETVNA